MWIEGEKRKTPLLHIIHYQQPTVEYGVHKLKQISALNNVLNYKFVYANVLH